MDKDPVTQTKISSIMSSNGILNISAYRYNDVCEDDKDWCYEIEFEPWSHYYRGEGECFSITLLEENFIGLKEIIDGVVNMTKDLKDE